MLDFNLSTLLAGGEERFERGDLLARSPRFFVRAYKLVRFAAIEDHLRIGWMVAIPNAVMHHHHYGCEMQWICGCRIPGDVKIFSHPAMSAL